MKYCDRESYNILYAKYMEKGCDEMFFNISTDKKRCLDLCCGNGRMTQFLLDRNASTVVCVDDSNEMINPSIISNSRVMFYKHNVIDYLKHIVDVHDIIVCQQAINYWFLKEENISKYLCNLLDKNGVFIFNTFNKKPSKIPMVKSYQFNGRYYTEVSYLINNVVHHIQTVDGLEPHITSFDWISTCEFHNKLSKYFTIVKEYVSGNSSLYHCFV